MSGKALSVTEQGEPDGWTPVPGYFGELNPKGPTRLVVSVPAADLPRVHETLIRTLANPLSVLYRQKVDRVNPRPQHAPPRDWVAVDLDPNRVVQAMTDHALLIYGDARHELWIRGGMHEQLVLDTDGLLYCYPDDPAFRDALEAAGITEAQVPTMADRDYVKHWFHAEADPHEEALRTALGLQEVPHRKR